MANNMKAEQSVEIFRCFGGGYQLEIDGDEIGIFPTARAAQDFAGAMLIAEAQNPGHPGHPVTCSRRCCNAERA